MIGIYKITNLINGQSYIGQSRNIEQRFKEHLYHKVSNIDRSIHELGAHNFSFEVLELCAEEQLDFKEDYYIRLFNTIDNGYNLVYGGQHNIGESNSNAKLTEQEVYDIRESYKNHERKFEVYDKYKDKISKSYFSNLWEGRSWEHVHSDVYTNENLQYYSSGASLIGQDVHNSIFSNLEVFELRKRYINESIDEIYESVKDRCSINTLRELLTGKTYSQIIVYSKRNKKWYRKRSL